jgi:hypothetical protein
VFKDGMWGADFDSGYEGPKVIDCANFSKESNNFIFVKIKQVFITRKINSLRSLEVQN